MTTTNSTGLTPQSPSESNAGSGTERRDGREDQHHEINVGMGERHLSIGVGAAIALLGLQRNSTIGLLVAGLGGLLIYRGATGYCGAYDAMGVNTAEE